MTQRWAYVGKLGPGEALDWGGDSSGNIPVSGRLKDLHSEAFWKIMELAEAGAYEGRQVDWGAWALKVNGPQLKHIIGLIYSAERLKEPWPLVQSYLTLADELGEGQCVALVAAEL